MTEDSKTYTVDEVRTEIERRDLVFALEHAIQRGKLSGDTPMMINPLVNLYNVITSPPAASAEGKGEEEE